MQQNFARSMSVADAMNPNNLPCYEMNGEPLPQPHGFPLRLIAPGWYGIANVKWPRRIEVRDTRFMGRFMGRDYVTIREEQRDGESAWMETSVGRALLKSVPARVTRENGQYRIIGAAWGAPIQGVEVQIDGGPWVLATIDRSEDAEFAWKSWSLEWRNPSQVSTRSYRAAHQHMSWPLSPVDRCAEMPGPVTGTTEASTCPPQPCGRGLGGRGAKISLDPRVVLVLSLN
jgi:DMSO/TMAO reductase YedYZ molybdopterin-dependent catalytic subunit